jgi:hypothetical protein
VQFHAALFLPTSADYIIFLYKRRRIEGIGRRLNLIRGQILAQEQDRRLFGVFAGDQEISLEETHAF